MGQIASLGLEPPWHEIQNYWRALPPQVHSAHKPHGLAQKAPSARPDMAALFYGSYHGGQQHEVACKHYNLTPPSMFEMA